MRQEITGQPQICKITSGFWFELQYITIRDFSGKSATIGTITSIADGVIVSTCLKTQNGWDPEKIREFIESARRNEKE